jgi:MraZ protein
MFRGRSKHTLDEKGRLAIPTRFMDDLKQVEASYVMVTNYIDCLCGYTMNDWDNIEKKVKDLPMMDEAVDAFLRYFISGAQPCEVKKGRITIPSELREIAGLKKDVVLAGLVTRFEIWDKDRWDEEIKRASIGFKDKGFRQALKDLGV